MLTGWRYRIGGAVGAIGLTVGVVLLGNQPFAQTFMTEYVPLFSNLAPEYLTGRSLGLAVMMSCLSVLAFSVPLFKPRPRRILDTIFLVQQRVFVAGLAIATLGYFQWSHRLPRQTLVFSFGLLFVVLPLWFVWIRRAPQSETDRAIIVGDDLDLIDQIEHEADLPFVGYLCPTSVFFDRDGERTVEAVVSPREAIADGGQLAHLDRLGGLSRLDDVLIEHNIDTVVLAFREADREEFFGALDACHEHGVQAKVHRKYADSVLTPQGELGTIVDVEIEPWDVQDYVIKRVFDVLFAWAGLVVLSPVILVIAAAIKLDSPGPLLYKQERTAGFGDTFPVYKFRTMVPEGESVDPVDDDKNDRITRVGRVLRRTHLDEIPQLWSIFVGDMSVVGPRAVWVDEEALLEQEAQSWRKRWFVKPGLTGLAQINDAKSTHPELKLRYDLEYIRRQSFWTDLAIVVRQLWKALGDTLGVVRGGDREAEDYE